MARNKDGETALHDAARVENTDIVVLLLADVGAKAKTGETALHFAAKEGHERTAIALLERGADVREGANDGREALHYKFLLFFTVPPQYIRR
jgi:ankyrin repeat protein